MAAARSGDRRAFDDLAAPHIRELRAHCYRMLGSVHDAEDALQEALLKGWRGLPGFDGRSSVRTWLYKIATHVCLDSLKQASRRLLPSATLPPADPSATPGPLDTEPIWLEPFPGHFLPETQSDPEARYTMRESIELAFMVAIQRLAPKQRAVLLLRDVLGWKVAEIADLLATSVPAVKSALQRARALVRQEEGDRRSRPSPAEERELLHRYMHAFEHRDIDALVALIHEDAEMTMPPAPEWFKGRVAIVEFLARWVFAVRLYLRVVATSANGQPALCIYEARDESSPYEPLSIQVLTFAGNEITEITGFVASSLARLFDVPDKLPA